MLVRTSKRCRTDNLEWLLNEIGVRDISEIEGLSISEFVEKYSRKHFSNLCLNKLLEMEAIYVPEGEKLIYDLPITSRLKNILLRNDVYVLSDIKKYSREEVMRFRNLGELTMKELEIVCEQEGIRLMSVNKIAERMHGVRFSYHQLIKMFHLHIWCPEDLCDLTEEQYSELTRLDGAMISKIKKVKQLFKV